MKKSANLRKGAGKGGFTIVELMFVVAIIGLIAAVAIPAFQKYLVRAKTAEAGISIKLISIGAKVYFDSEHTTGANHYFPANIAQTPNAVARGTKNKLTTVIDQFKNNASWVAIGYNPSGDFYYSYAFASDCTGECTEGKIGTIHAYGDLDGDGITSHFYKNEQVIRGNLEGDALRVADELE